MGRLITLLGGVLIGGVMMYIAFNYHVVVSEQSWYMVPKKEAQLSEVYVDIREWGFQDWADHPRLAEAMIEAGHGDLVKQQVQDGILDSIFRKIGGTDQLRK